MLRYDICQQVRLAKQCDVRSWVVGIHRSAAADQKSSHHPPTTENEYCRNVLCPCPFVSTVFSHHHEQTHESSLLRCQLDDWPIAFVPFRRAGALVVVVEQSPRATQSHQQVVALVRTP